MLVDIVRTAQNEWQTFTGRDLEILFKVHWQAAQQAAEIARSMGQVEVANEILEKAMHP
jgi:hypothetical protein